MLVGRILDPRQNGLALSLGRFLLRTSHLLVASLVRPEHQHPQHARRDYYDRIADIQDGDGRQVPGLLLRQEDLRERISLVALPAGTLLRST